MKHLIQQAQILVRNSPREAVRKILNTFHVLLTDTPGVFLNKTRAYCRGNRLTSPRVMNLSVAVEVVLALYFVLFFFSMSTNIKIYCNRGQILCSLGDELSQQLPQCLPIFLDRLRNEITRLTTVKAYSLIAGCVVEC